MVKGELDLVAVEWALEHGGPVDYFLTEAGRHLADAERLNSETPALLLRRARSSVLEARWLMTRNADAFPILETGLAAADEGLAVDPSDPEFLVVKGRLHLLAAQVSGDENARRKEADRALEVLKSAEGLNPLLSSTCSPLIAEARQLRGEFSS